MLQCIKGLTTPCIRGMANENRDKRDVLHTSDTPHMGTLR
jgi:hypothetical protein